MAKSKQPQKKNPIFSISGWKNSRGVRLALFFLFVLLFYFAVSPKWIQQTYDIELNAISDRDIISPSTIVNEAATLRARTNASEQVEAVTTVVQMRNEDLIELIFDKIEQVNPDTMIAASDKIAIYRAEFPQIYREFYDGYLRSLRDIYNQPLLDEIEKKVMEYEYRVPEETYYKLPLIKVEDLAEMEAVTKSIVSRLMSDRLTETEVARSKVPELVNSSQLESKNAREIVQEIARFTLTPNKFYDEEATKEAKLRAAENLEPIYVNKGDIVVAKNERITEEKYALLEDLGLLKDRTNYWPQAGTAVLVLLFAIVLYLFIRQSELPIASSNSPLLMLLIIFAITTIAIMIVSLGQGERLPYIGYMAPAAMGSMLIALLLDARLAFIATVVFSVLASVILNESDQMLFDYRYGFVAAVVCFVSVFAIQKASQRASILRAGALISVFSALASSAMMLIEGSYSVKNLLYALGFSVAGGVLTAVLVIGLLPFFEIAFGILSPLKLVELSNPNHPLLRKLLTETPGTYHHSVMVGNLAEAAAEAIGANGLLCRVGSFYHDIGKTKRPSYFIENQNNIENPHDQIDPSLSKSIIIAHARDGVEMLAAHKIPKQIRDIAEQHHGTTLLVYFYHKALKQLEESGATDKTISEEEYRYPGPKAQSREAAIVGIADGLEAAVRSLRNPTPDEIDALVRKIIKHRLDDGQFDECDLTMKELDTIARTLKETLLGIFHSRIEYPEELPVKNSYPKAKETEKGDEPQAGMEH